MSRVLPSMLTSRHCRYHAPRVEAVAIGPTTSSWSCRSTAAPTRERAWEIAALPATFSFLPGSASHSNPSSKQRSTSR